MSNLQKVKARISARAGVQAQRRNEAWKEGTLTLAETFRQHIEKNQLTGTVI